MKKTLLALAVLLFCGFMVFADDAGDEFQVKVSKTAEKNSYDLKKDLETEAKKAAIKKYILRVNPQAPETMIKEACAEYSNFVDDVDKLSEKWESLDKKLGQLTGEYNVTLKVDSINQWLERKGFKQQGGIELVILEERPSLGQMKVDKAFGNGVDGKKFFMQNYSTFQRRLRDMIVKKVDSYGFDVKLLEDNDMYEEFKSKDGTLVGVYFDVNENDFVIDENLLKTVKENNPDTLVLYYRIDALIFEESTRNIRVTVALNMKDLNTNVTKSVGSESFSFKSKSEAIDGVMDDMAYCAESAMQSLMKTQGAAAKLNNIAMSIKNSAATTKGQLKLVVNVSAFDSKISKKVLYTLKKELIAKKIASESKIKSTNTTLTATIDNPKIKAPDELYMEYISPILEENGFEVTDDCVDYSGNTLTIKQQ